MKVQVNKGYKNSHHFATTVSDVRLIMTNEAAVGSTKEDVANYEDESISAHLIDTCVRKTEI